jgi:CheY-like chemotaxis protein
VFEPFVQADRPRDSALGGLGLGLTLVKRLAEMHGGRAEARSEGPGRGSEFLVWLPALTLYSGESSSGRGAREPGKLCLAGRRVLVVDDAPDSAESLAQYLSLLGCQVQVVNDGQAGLAAVEQTPPEIVFLDLRMPGMSGLDVARQLRRGQGANHMVLVATTGDGQPEDRRQTTEAGFDYHLTKPMDIGQLLAIISADRE